MVEQICARGGARSRGCNAIDLRLNCENAWRGAAAADKLDCVIAPLAGDVEQLAIGARIAPMRANTASWSPPSARLRGGALQRHREEYFRLHPLCERCFAKEPRVLTLAVVLDHRVALSNGGPDFDEPGGEANKQGLCNECHVLKTREDVGYRLDKPVARRIGLDGWPVSEMN
jgi:5-methylcytosine-specific restriction endonuclease McrA